MTKEQKAFFNSRGFLKTGRRTLHQQHDWRWWYVNEIGSQEGETRLHLAIGIKDPFREDAGFGLLSLMGDVTPGGVFVHYDDTPYWIAKAEQPAILQVLERAADMWFEHWDKTDVLIEHFRNPAGVVALHARPVDRFISFERSEVVRPRIIPIHDYWLSLIYFHSGRFSDSLDYSKKWLNVVERMGSDDTEPERTRKHISDLKKRIQANN
jgi:hypothetical protein